jgi:hypothetical protein
MGAGTEIADGDDRIAAGASALTVVRVDGPDNIAVFAIRPGRPDVGGYGGSSPRETSVTVAAADLAPTAAADQLVGDVASAGDDRHEQQRAEETEEHVDEGVQDEEDNDSADYDGADLEQAHNSRPFLFGHIR